MFYIVMLIEGDADLVSGSNMCLESGDLQAMTCRTVVRTANVV